MKLYEIFEQTWPKGKDNGKDSEVHRYYFIDEGARDKFFAKLLKNHAAATSVLNDKFYFGKDFFFIRDVIETID